MSVATERKLVTVLFCDLVGSTALGEALDVEALGSVQAAYFDRMRAVVELFGGTVEKFAGDAVVAVFGVPVQHEDDAERAVRCALALREALVGLTDTLRPRFGVELELRVGVATGDAVVGSSEALATGDVMNTAARLEQAAEAGQVLVGGDTMQLTSDAFDYGAELRVEAKGKREPVSAWPVLAATARRMRALSPLVGRGTELELLTATVERAIREREPQAVVVLGEPGIGKTRLAEEFEARAAGRARVLHGASPPYGEGSAWLPLAAVVRSEAGIGDADGEEEARVKLHRKLVTRHDAGELPLVEAQLAALASRAAGSEYELLWTMRRYFEALAFPHPAVVVLDDLHWADGMLLEAVQELFQAIGSVSLTFVLQGRPELRDRLPELIADERVTVLPLGALAEEDAAALVDNLAGASWSADVRAAIVERGEGSPLFLEEISAVANEDGVGAGVPRSLRALIGARLDLFAPDVKRIAQAAAVVGNVFWDGAVVAVADVDGAAMALRRLRTGGFVNEQPESAFLGARQFRFHHALVREVTYESIPKLERAQLHRRAAEWLDTHAGRPDVVLAVAHHLGQAVTLRREVAPLEPVDPPVVHAAVDALRGAASWTASTGSVHQATELLRTAVDLAGDDSELAELASAQLAAVLARSGAGGEAVKLADRVLETGGATREASALAALALAEAARAGHDPDVMMAAGTRALEEAEPLGLLGIQVEAHDIVGLAHAISGRLSLSVEHRRRATEIARELGDLPRVAWNLAGHSAISLMELGRVDEADAQVGEAMRLAVETGSLRALEAAHAASVFIRRTQDRLEDAAYHGRERVRVAEQLGESLWLFNALTVNLARTLLELEQYDEAEACLDRALEVSARSSVPPDVAHAFRALIHVRRGRLEEAESEMELVASPQFYDELALLREAEGRADEADEVWQVVLAEFERTEARVERAEKNVAYARFLVGQGRTDEARARLGEARELVAGVGAAYVERLAREVDALL